MKPLKQIDALPKEQQEQLAEWLLNGTLEKAGELALKEFGQEIPQTTLHRFRHRCTVTSYLDTSPESARARAELINAAASGKPNFCQATVDLLEKQAFELAHATRDDGVMDALKNLLGLINGHKNTSVRERMATVQERKADLREQELTLKQSLAHAKNQSAIRNGQSGSDPQSAIESDELGRLATTLDDVEDRATKLFNLPPIDRSSPVDSLPTVGTTSTSSQISSPENQQQTTENPSPTSVESPAPGSPLSPLPPMPPHQSTNPPIQPSSLEDRVNEYTLARYHEALHGKDSSKVGRAAAYNFKSKMQWCPCGHHLPCPDHGDFPKRFWEIRPDDADYMELFRLKGLPYTSPHVLMVEQEKRERRARAHVPSPDALRESSKAYAIKRWRAYTPRPAGVPFPDESYAHQCPCGAEHPCDLHPDLFHETRYLKPWTNDYIAALKREGIPIYTPSETEIKFWLKPSPPAPAPNPDISSHPPAEQLVNPVVPSSVPGGTHESTETTALSVCSPPNGHTTATPSSPSLDLLSHVRPS